MVEDPFNCETGMRGPVTCMPIKYRLTALISATKLITRYYSNETLTHCCFNASPTSATLAQLQTNIGGVYNVLGGTGMIASSTTFRPHPGRVIRDLFRLLNAVLHCTKVLVYSNHQREAAASSYLAIIFRRYASGVPWFLRLTTEPMQHTHQCRRWCRPW